MHAPAASFSVGSASAGHHGRFPYGALEGQLEGSVPGAGDAARDATSLNGASVTRSPCAWGTEAAELSAGAGARGQPPVSTPVLELAPDSLALHQQLEQVGRLLSRAGRELNARKKEEAVGTPSASARPNNGTSGAYAIPPAVTSPSMSDLRFFPGAARGPGQRAIPAHSVFSQHLQQEESVSRNQEDTRGQGVSRTASLPHSPSISATSTPSVPRSPDVPARVRPFVTKRTGASSSPLLSSSQPEVPERDLLHSLSPLSGEVQAEVSAPLSERLQASQDGGETPPFPVGAGQESAPSAKQRKIENALVPGLQSVGSLAALDGSDSPCGLPSSQAVLAFLRQQNIQSPLRRYQGGEEQGLARRSSSAWEVRVVPPAGEQAETPNENVLLSGQNSAPSALTTSPDLVEAAASVCGHHSKSADKEGGGESGSLPASAGLQADRKQQQQQLAHQQLAVFLAAALKLAEQRSKLTSVPASQGSEGPLVELGGNREEGAASLVTCGRDWSSGDYQRRLLEATAVLRALKVPAPSSSSAATTGFISDVSKKLLAAAGVGGGVAHGPGTAGDLPQQAVPGVTDGARGTVTPEGSTPGASDRAAPSGAVSGSGGRGRLVSRRGGDLRTRDFADTVFRPSSASSRRTPSPRSECSVNSRRGGGNGAEKGMGPHLPFPSSSEFKECVSRYRSPSRRRAHARGDGRRNSSSCSEDSNVGDCSGPRSPTPSSGNRTPRRGGVNDDEELVPIGELPTGVYFDVARRLWRCQWREDGRLKSSGFSLKQYKTLEEAREACILYKCAVTNTPVNPAWLVPQYIPASQASKRNLRYRQASAPSTPQLSSTSNVSPIPRSEEESEDSISNCRGPGGVDAEQGNPGVCSLGRTSSVVPESEEGGEHHDQVCLGGSASLCLGGTLGSGVSESDLTGTDVLHATREIAVERGPMKSFLSGYVNAAAGTPSRAADSSCLRDRGSDSFCQRAFSEGMKAGLVASAALSETCDASGPTENSRRETYKSAARVQDSTLAAPVDEVLQLLARGRYKRGDKLHSSASPESTRLQPGLLSSASPGTVPTLENLAEFIRRASGNKAMPVAKGNEKEAASAGAGRLADVSAGFPVDLTPKAGMGGLALAAALPATPAPGEGGSSSCGTRDGVQEECTSMTVGFSDVPLAASDFSVSGCIGRETGGQQPGVQLREASRARNAFFQGLGPASSAAATADPGLLSVPVRSPDFTGTGESAGLKAGHPVAESVKGLRTSSTTVSETQCLIAVSGVPTPGAETNVERAREPSPAAGLGQQKQERKDAQEPFPSCSFQNAQSFGATP